MKGSGFGASASLLPVSSSDQLDVAVVLLDVADAFGCERLVALLHLAHRPAQRVGRLLRIDDDRREQVRNLLVHPELEPLGVDHDQPHVVGRRAVEDARQHRVQADRLAGAGRAGDEQVRHRGQVGDVRLAVDRLAERERQLGASSADSASDSSSSRSEIASRLGFGIWMPTVDLPGMRSISTDSACIARHRSSARLGDLAVLHAGFRLELEGRDDGAGMNLRDLSLDGELAALLLELPRRVHQLALVDLLLGLRGVEQRQRRQRERALAARRALIGSGSGSGSGGAIVRRRASCADDRRRGRSSVARFSLRSSPSSPATVTAAARSLLGVLGDHLAALLLLAPVVEPARGGSRRRAPTDRAIPGWRWRTSGRTRTASTG